MEALTKLSVVERDTELKSILKSLSAFRRGESGVTLPTEWEGVYGKIAAEFNQLSAMAAATTSRCKSMAAKPRSVSRASRRLPEEKLSGFWLENTMALNSVLEEADAAAECTKVVLTALTDLKKGDARASLPQDWTGVPGKVADAFNEVVSENVRMEGWRVLERVKQDFSVRHIPVCVISTDDSQERAYRSGAMAVSSPASRTGTDAFTWARAPSACRS